MLTDTQPTPPSINKYVTCNEAKGSHTKIPSIINYFVGFMFRLR